VTTDTVTDALDGLLSDADRREMDPAALEWLTELLEHGESAASHSEK
jgi:hypothetical protein